MSAESLGNTVLTLKNIKEEIESSLGASGVDVELEESDVRKVVKDTIRRYNRARPGRGHAAIPITKDQKRYVIDYEGSGIRGIVKVEFVEKTNFTGDPFDPFYYNRMGLTPQGDTFAEYDQKRQYIEQARRVGSSEPEWQQRVETNQQTGKQEVVLYIDIDAPFFCQLTYTYHYTPDDDSETGMQRIPDGDTDWIIEYATALAKMIVARKRAKYRGVILPGGTTADTDGTDLLQEGRDEKRELEERLSKRRRPLLPEIE